MRDLKSVLADVIEWKYASGGHPFMVLLVAPAGKPMDELLAGLLEHGITPMSRRPARRLADPEAKLERATFDNPASLRVTEALGISYSKDGQVLDLASMTFPVWIGRSRTSLDQDFDLTPAQKTSAIYMGDCSFSGTDSQALQAWADAGLFQVYQVSEAEIG